MTCKGCKKRREWFKERIKIMTRGRVVTIWDGKQYRQVSEKEGERLVEKDMAQIMSRGLIGGTEMKHRRDFTGYQTREIRAKEPVMPENTTEKEVEISKPKVDWKAHREAAAESLDKPVNKTTKAQTLEYMESLK